MTLSIALAQIQLPPNYGPAYQAQVAKKSSGAPKSPMRTARAARMLEICRKIGESNVDDILAVYRQNDDGVHKDDARKILDELTEEGKLSKRTITKCGRRRALYKAGSPENRVGTGQMNNNQKTEFRVERK